MFSKLRARADVCGVGLAFALLAALSFIPMRLAAQGDTTPPTISLTAPAADAIVANSIAVAATASDNVGVAGVQFELDGAPLGAEDVAAPFAISWNTRGSTDLVFGVSKVVVGPMTISPGAGFTKRLGVSCSGCSGNDLATEDKVQSAAGPTAATFTYTIAAHYLAHMAAFKATGTPAYVQGVTATSNSASSTIARAFGSAVSAGNLVIVAVAWEGNSAVSVSDSRGNVYAAATSAYDAVNGQSLAILYAANAAAGATTVTANFGGTAKVKRLALHEYSGMASTSPLDVTATNIANGTTTSDNITSGSATTGVMLPVSDGSHTLTAQGRDAAGNIATSVAVPVTVSNNGDPTAPVISAVTVSSITGSGATIDWTTDEASDSQADYGLTTAYGSTSTLNASLVSTHTASLSGLTGSTLYHARVRSRDAAGNLGLSGDVTFTTVSGTDGTAPVVSISAPGGGTTVFGAVPVSATASDNVGVAGVQFRVDGALLGSEDVAAPYAITWNTAGSADLVFGVTKVAVGPMTMTPGSGLTKRLSVTCAGCSGEDLASEDKIQTSAGSTAVPWTFSIAAHYLAQMAAFKAAGTPAYVQGATATSNAASATAAQAFAANVVAGHLVVVGIAWQGNSAVSVTDTRGNVYRVATSAYDAVNGQSLAILYAANTAAGATTVTASFGGASPTLHRLAIHEYSGVATTSPLDGTAANIADGTTTANAITSGSAATTVTAPVTTGSHTLTAVARDAAGNTTTSAAVTVTVNNGDITPPVISGVAAASITSSGATVNWTTNEASDSQVDYGLTTAYGSTSPSNGSFVTTHAVILGSLAGNTTYHVRARSKDAAGNLALSADVAFTTVAVDSSLPVVSITAPASGATVSGTTTFSATATDNVGVAGVEFKRDGVLIAPEDTASPYLVSWNTTTATAGTHTLTAVAWDAAGNSATATRTVTVSNPLATVNLAWNANTESDLAGYKVYVGTSSGVYSTTYNVGKVISYTVAGLSPGNVYYFVVTAYDTTSFESPVSNEVNATK
jgi:hypothetical protein